jgi:UDP-glucuronate 4-epimerase
MKRDFTYVDDIVQGVWLVSQNMTNRDIYCLGNGTQINLMDFIHEIEKNVGKEAEKVFLPRHPADALETWSDTAKIQKLGYKSTTPVAVGVQNFVQWYRNYYGKNDTHIS